MVLLRKSQRTAVLNTTGRTRTRHNIIVQLQPFRRLINRLTRSQPNLQLIAESNPTILTEIRSRSRIDPSQKSRLRTGQTKLSSIRPAKSVSTAKASAKRCNNQPKITLVSVEFFTDISIN